MPGTTPNKGIRYPLMTETGDSNVLAAMVFDLDAMATADDSLRTTALTQRGAQITNSTAPNITKLTNTKFTYDTVVYDPSGLSNLGVNNDRFTINRAGLWMFGLTWVISNAGSGGLGLFFAEATLAKNTTTAPAVPNLRRHKFPGYTGTASGTAECTISAPFVMAVSDFVTSQCFWNGSAAGPAVSLSPPVFWAIPLALT
jgi:hypothetical protein